MFKAFDRVQDGDGSGPGPGKMKRRRRGRRGCCIGAALVGSVAAVCMNVNPAAAAAGATSATFAGYTASFPGTGTVVATQRVAAIPPVFTTSQVVSEVGLVGSGVASVTYVSSDNRVLYQAQIGTSAMAVNAGDIVRMQVTAKASPLRWTGTITDATQQKSITADGSESAAPKVAYVDMYRVATGSSYLPIPNFGTTSFYAASVAGVPLASASGLTPEQMTSNSGQRLVTAGTVTAKTFTETFVNQGP